MTTAVERADGVAFVRWHAADDVHAVERAILQLQKAAMFEGRPAGITFCLTDRELVVFDSVEPGLEQSRFSLPEQRDLGEGSLRVPIAPGTYGIHLGELDPAVGSLSIVQLIHEPS